MFALYLTVIIIPLYVEDSKTSQKGESGVRNNKSSPAQRNSTQKQEHLSHVTNANKKKVCCDCGKTAILLTVKKNSINKGLV